MQEKTHTVNTPLVATSDQHLKPHLGRYGLHVNHVMQSSHKK